MVKILSSTNKTNNAFLRNSQRFQGQHAIRHEITIQSNRSLYYLERLAAVVPPVDRVGSSQHRRARIERRLFLKCKKAI